MILEIQITRIGARTKENELSKVLKSHGRKEVDYLVERGSTGRKEVNYTTWSEGGSTTRHGQKEEFDYSTWSKEGFDCSARSKGGFACSMWSKGQEIEQGTESSPRPRERLEKVDGRRTAEGKLAVEGEEGR
uniref:Uncharacterized protein n=1 Tax=Phyllostachys edulis TaxID=38705 RepID=D3IVQ3_PHYED|nr:hypothetical protein [Phyllostachys edulis]